MVSVNGQVCSKHLVLLTGHPPSAPLGSQEGVLLLGKLGSASACWGLLAGTEVTLKPEERQRLCPSMSPGLTSAVCSQCHDAQAGETINTSALGDRGLTAFEHSVAF